MIEVVLVVSILNLFLQLVAVWQRHLSIQVQKRNGGGYEP